MRRRVRSYFRQSNLHRGRSQHGQFLVIYIHLSFGTCRVTGRQDIGVEILADVNVTQKSSGFRWLLYQWAVAGATFPRNGPFGATVLMLPFGRT